MNYRAALKTTRNIAYLQRNNWRDAPCTEMSFGHIEKMMDRINSEDMSDTKLCRWLGWMQATVVSMTYPYTSLETMKNINRGCKT